MKTKRFLPSIVNIIVLAVAAVSLMQMASCSKNNDVNPTSEEILTKRIEDILPQKYIDTLSKLGLTVNKGTTPPNIEGAYFIAPLRLLNSNVPGDVIGKSFNNANVKFYNQSNENFKIDIVGRHFLSATDTSMITAISGSGNNFTVYGKVKAVNGSFYAYSGLLISGVKEGNTLKDVVYGIINIDDSKGGGIFIPEGRGRVVYDIDKTSESATFPTSGFVAPGGISVANSKSPALK